MTNPHDLDLTPLARRALLPLQGGTGLAVGVFSGSVWITEENGPDDHVLQAGESMVLRRPGLALVEGLQDSQLILFESGEPTGRRAGPLAARAALDAPSHGAGAAEPTPPRLSVVEYERIARELRQQAVADAFSWLLRRVGRALKGPATPPPALPRPTPRLAWHGRG